ncbi:MAG: N-acetyltransferase [Phaeodactylibacter sp.]|nr:N-acetyltransferase [Phaeodactylibacter sp.]
MPTMIRPLSPADWPAVRAIYESGIATSLATFETEAPEWEEWNSKHHPFARLVAESGGQVLGWVALSPVSARWVYRGVAELSIYIAEGRRGQGIGQLLIGHAISESEAHHIWTLQASIFPENKASVHLHQKAGFRIVGIRKRIGQLHGVWRDVVLLERRSPLFS